MAKLIFTSRYIRDDPPEHLQNYVRYISTREGVEKVDESKKNLPVTPAQKNLIRQLIKDMPESKDMLEYEDYRKHPTIGNASEFITQALERNLDMAAMKENYVDYLANRPRVERIGEHGLFTDAGKPVILADVQKEVSEHKGPVWTHVVSLRREDAARLGYDSAREWMSLLRSKRAMLCKYMKIDSGDLRWYAAFHNEGHHPHVHLMVYSAKDNDGYLTKAGIEAMRSELAHDIFRQDFAQIYEGQNLARNSLKEKAAERMCLLTDEMMQGVCGNPAIGEKLLQLSERLKHTRGKKVYGYLKADVKRLVDQIVDELAKDPTVAEAYRAWGEWQEKILLTYSSKASSLPPLSSQKQLKSIKNMVIAEALKLGGHHFLYETSMQGDDNTGIRLDELEEETISDEGEEAGAVPADTEDRIVVTNAEDPLPEPEMPFYEEGENGSAKAEWNKRYKLARSYLYGSERIPQDFAEAMGLFSLEADSGNALAMYDLGRMWADGLGVEADPDMAQEWYRKALAAFGYVVYCFDFCGGSPGSRSDGSTLEMSIFTEQADLEAVIDMMRGHPFVDEENIFLMGTSQGGAVSAITAADNRERVRGAILLYPAFVLVDHTKERFKRVEDIPETYELMWMTVGRTYGEKLLDYDIYEAISAYDQDVLLIHGDADGIVPLSYSERAVEVYDSARLEVLEGAGHGFSGADARQATDWILEYLEQHKQ